jgi:hypothetical protein
MSYSFNVRVASVALAAAAIASKFDEVVTPHQPVHANDRDAAIAAATSMTSFLAEPAEGEEISISVSGWLQWRAGDGMQEAGHEFTGASVNVQASIVAKTE